MIYKRNKKRIEFFILAISIVVLDQTSKILLTKILNQGYILEILPSFLNFSLVYNYGAAFSILSNQSILLKFISLFASILLILILFLKPIKNNYQYLSLSSLIGGTIGNGIDRWTYGYVIDFIDLQFIDFPIFNIADIAINIGVILYLIHLALKKYKKNHRSNTISYQETKNK